MEEFTMKRRFSIRDMAVKNKLLVFSTIALLFIIGLALGSLFVVKNTNTARTNRYVIYGERETAISNAYAYFNQVKVDTRNIIFLFAEDNAKIQEEIQSVNAEREKMKEQFQIFSQYLDLYNQNIVTNYNKVVENMNSYIESVEKIISYVQVGNIQAAQQELLNTGITTADATEAVFETLMDDLVAAADENSAAIDKEISAMTAILITVCVVCFLFVAFYCYTLIRSITVPIEKLSEAANKLAMGDVEVDCTKIAEDDLGALMDNFRHMAEAIKEQALIADAIATGDMTVEVKPRSERDLLGKALQKLTEDNNRTLGNVKESTMQVTIGAEQVANASQALAQGSTEQASALQQITASINEIAENTKKNATEATTANNLVENVKAMAADGNEQMKSMIGAMNDINESSETISKIIKVIDDIAFQTNILALNAAVEAARAGIHGKGFAVVAEEVRTLAAKSASAAKETAEMIEDSIHKVGNGQKLATQTAEALDKIVNSIQDVAKLIENIAVSSNDQATAVSQIDQAIGQVSTVVQTNSATSEQCAAASEELSNQAVNLRNLMAGYKLTVDTQNANIYHSGGRKEYRSGNANEKIISLDGEFGKY